MMMARCSRYRLPLPRDWTSSVKFAVVQAISLASVAPTIARSRAAGGDRERRLQGQVDAADTEIALLREELNIKDARWSRLHSRRRPHYTPIQRMRILQVKATRRWNRE